MIKSSSKTIMEGKLEAWFGQEVYLSIDEQSIINELSEFDGHKVRITIEEIE
jgi:hypothetical protein